MIDSSPTKAESYALSILSWRPQKAAWRNQKRKGRLATWARSRKRDRALARQIERPDVVIHVRNTYLPANTPYVVFIDGTASLSQRFWPDWRMSERAYETRVAQERRYFSQALLVATAGQHAAREVIDFYGQAPDRVVAVGGGTNITAPERAPVRVSGTADGTRFLFIGKDFDRKGGPELLQAFSRLRGSRDDVTLEIIGPEATTTPLPTGVAWRGFITDRDLIGAAYREADVFCLPSRYEPYGLVIQEALAYGLPCLVSDRGALAEIAGDAGLIVEAESVDSIHDGLLALAGDGELRRRLGAAAITRLDGMSWEAVADRMLSRLLPALWPQDRHPQP
ncbi:glycosyltransferase family 4 protein [Microbacterium sp. F51-2R]|uniref:glycosyltransferase family 4 protein n=1 Tax=Microbacterium sp. F51-2R TaxID=3445777 RepID=UPI003F9EF79D